MSEKRAANGTRMNDGHGRLYESVLDTVGNTPCIRVNNLAPDGVRVYVKSEFFNPAARSRIGSRSTSSRPPSAAAR